MANERIRIATRKSPLALWQAEFVAARLRERDPGTEVEVIGMSTRGDQVLDRPLAAVGGKGLFVKELQQRLLDDEADIAVHSMKDVPADEDGPEALHLAAIMARENPFDAFVSRRYRHPDELPEGAVIGTCSLRRAAQLLHRLPHCRVSDLRGNVNTRLRKLDDGEFDAIVLACAGLERLDFGERITAALEPEVCLPGIGQGALGVECRVDDDRVNARVEALADATTTACVLAERAVTRGLGGSCLSPIAAYATLDDGRLALEGRVGAADGSRLLAARSSGDASEPLAVGARVAAELDAQGARALLGH